MSNQINADNNTMKLLVTLVVSLFFAFQLHANTGLTPEQSTKYKQDLEYYLTTVENNYAYFDKKKTDWHKVRAFAWRNFAKVRNYTDFLTLIERLQLELYDNHVQLLNSTPYSPKVLPSSADIYAQIHQGKAFVVNLLPNSAAHQTLAIDDKITHIDGKPVKDAITRYIGTSFPEIDDEIRSWALNVALAGQRNKSREISILRKGKPLTISLAETQFLQFDTPLLAKRIKDYGYIRFNNSLGNNEIISEFPKTLESLADTKGLILDLRFTSGGGNSLIARAVLGHFIDQDQFYQKHEYPNEIRDYGVKRSWAEIVSPLKPYYAKPVTVLVNQWTGSMGEGMTLGLDNIGATVVGTLMAQLLGSMWDYRMPNSNIGFKVSTQKMYHVTGTPREDFKPTIFVNITTKNQDEILNAAIKHLDSIKK